MTVATPQPLSIEQVAALSPDRQQAYISTLPPDQQAQVVAQLAGGSKPILMKQGADFLAKTIRKAELCVMTSGGALSQAWSTGSALQFTVPQVLNGWLEAYVLRFVLTVNLATGTSAVYALTPGGPLALVSEILLQYGNAQHRLPLRVFQDYKQLRAKLEPLNYEPVLGGGRSVSAIDTYLNGGSGGTFGVATGNNTWQFEVEIPTNLVHSLDPRGLLPIMGNKTLPLIQVTCNPAPFGTDPFNNALYAVSGSGHVATVTGTVSVFAKYRDGDSLTERRTFTFSPGNLGVMQAFYDGTLNNLAAGQTQPYQIKHVGRHYWIIAYVIDGQASNLFCADSNITQADIVKDSSGTNAFWRIGGDTNISYLEWLSDLRRVYGQDLPEGTVPFVYAPANNTVNPDNMDGIAVFDNTSDNGWPAAQFRVKVTNVGAAVSGGARILYYTFYENPSPLQVIG